MSLHCSLELIRPTVGRNDSACSPADAGLLRTIFVTAWLMTRWLGYNPRMPTRAAIVVAAVIVTSFTVTGCIQVSHPIWDGVLPAVPPGRMPDLLHVRVDEEIRSGDSSSPVTLDASPWLAGALEATGYVRCVTGSAVPAEALRLRGCLRSDTQFAGPWIWPYLTLLTVGVVPCWNTHEVMVALEVVTPTEDGHALGLVDAETTVAWLPLLVATPFYAERLVQGGHEDLAEAIIGRMLAEGLLPR